MPPIRVGARLRTRITGGTRSAVRARPAGRRRAGRDADGAEMLPTPIGRPTGRPPFPATRVRPAIPGSRERRMGTRRGGDRRSRAPADRSAVSGGRPRQAISRAAASSSWSERRRGRPHHQTGVARSSSSRTLLGSDHHTSQASAGSASSSIRRSNRPSRRSRSCSASLQALMAAPRQIPRQAMCQRLGSVRFGLSAKCFSI